MTIPAHIILVRTCVWFCFLGYLLQLPPFARLGVTLLRFLVVADLLHPSLGARLSRNTCVYALWFLDWFMNWILGSQP